MDWHNLAASVASAGVVAGTFYWAHNSMGLRWESAAWASLLGVTVVSSGIMILAKHKIQRDEKQEQEIYQQNAETELAKIKRDKDKEMFYFNKDQYRFIWAENDRKVVCVDREKEGKFLRLDFEGNESFPHKVFLPNEGVCAVGMPLDGKVSLFRKEQGEWEKVSSLAMTDKEKIQKLISEFKEFVYERPVQEADLAPDRKQVQKERER